MERMELDVMMIRINGLMSSGRYAEARRLLEEVIDAEPAHGIAHGMLGWICWALLEENERALVHFRCAVRWAPTYLNAWMHYLNLLASMGAGDELLDAAGRALAMNGIDRSEVHAIVARFLERAGRHEAALERHRMALSASATAAAENEHRAHIRRLRARIRRARWAI